MVRLHCEAMLPLCATPGFFDHTAREQLQGLAWDPQLSRKGSVNGIQNGTV